ncbi:hypothetical protein CANTEDRAFT_96252 [Yamadazyma tenuis ATCC 10573]|uniref:Uncharacterized protein n=1 Tax=Candida tenuis (strain ATCC 10573 / BCRC 21748 / CBS 615 / JCM 9827 / NBRC 10315 / NRRL Y-1498 / VKM Y-70) TaxID=590646 RepID=G3BCE0_CANTC|nr:uncharacterized protein CANTEDRAFT_96252 [Yamadazyma tenuis ATCC 10573]EGV60814.1 hypothetical protein CANTEDRAFT_96252 [Yamadazyma tenuis ATCC 10573]
MASHKRTTSNNSNFSLKSSRSSGSSKSGSSSKSAPQVSHSRTSSSNSSSNGSTNYTYSLPVTKGLGSKSKNSIKPPTRPPPGSRSSSSSRQLPTLKTQSSIIFHPRPVVTPTQTHHHSELSSSYHSSHGQSPYTSTPPTPPTPPLRHSKSLGHLLHAKPPKLSPSKSTMRLPNKYKEDLLKNECTCKGCKNEKSSKTKSHHSISSAHQHQHQRQRQHGANSDTNSVDSVDNFANNILDFVYNKREVKWNI